MERRLVDYKIQVTPELVERWEQMLRAAEASGFRVRSFAEADKAASSRGLLVGLGDSVLPPLGLSIELSG